jgi:hypothetical protein
LTTNVDGRLAALKSSTPINGFQLPLFTVPISEATASGMVSPKIRGLHISESRQKSRSTERLKMIDDWRTGRSFPKPERTERLWSRVVLETNAECATV